MQVRSILCFALLAGIVQTALADGIEDSSPATIDFDTQIIPLLTRYGCNAGSCHGAAIGRGGFKLSLLGSGAAEDHDAIVHALEGRRVNRFMPERSLLLLKPTEQIGHEGGLVFEEDSPAFDRMRTWIEQGAQRARTRRLASLSVSPQDALVAHSGDSVPLRVMATFTEPSSGRSSQTDVTEWTVFTPGDAEAVTIDRQERQITVLRSGVHVVIARFMDRVLPIRLTVPIHSADTNIVADSPPATSSSSTDNPIDRFVDDQLKRLRLPASPRSDDHAFLRRVTLDLAGRLPTPEETERFASDPSADKRDNKIDALLGSPDFADYWALKWANILAIDAAELQTEGADAYHRWLADRIGNDTPMHLMARDLLTALGDSFHVGPANFSRFGKSPGDLAEHVSQAFMGVRLRCANCHNHPLDHWTQDDYHGLSAVFAKLKRGRIVSVSTRGEVTHPVTGQPATPRIPGLRFLQPDESGRDAFAAWLTSDNNPYLATVTANRIWRELMGRGLVEPVDDMRATNPATHPELLDWLADDFANHGFSMKSTIATICRSEAYQRQSQGVSGNESDVQFYSHALVRPLEAEVVADAIGDVTGVPLDVSDGSQSRTITLTDNRIESRTLDLLGRCDRSLGCDATGDSRATLTRALHMINGSLLQERITSPDGTLATLLASGDDNASVLDRLMLSALSRPDASASDLWKRELENANLQSDETRREFFEDVFWGILASDTFATNH
tara:strand:- start:53060 stop:55255 length:2196 start_codon:yes stop_codon:yes gene_type:complete